MIPNEVMDFSVFGEMRNACFKTKIDTRQEDNLNSMEL